MEKFTDEDYIFPGQKTAASLDKESICRILYETAYDIGIDGFGNESISKTYGYFHYKKFRDIEKLRKSFRLESPTAALRLIGYKGYRYLCFYCNIGCLWKIR